MLPLLYLIPAALLGGTAFVVASKKKPAVMTPDREMLYQRLLRDPVMSMDPAVLRQNAKLFRDDRFFPQADMLERRASIRELPQPQKEELRVIYRQAMSSNNSAAILNVADNFEAMGAINAAEDLRAYAHGLPNAVTAPVPPPPSPDASPPVNPGDLT